jgi:ribose 5-phosphate isomerase RpiB
MSDSGALLWSKRVFAADDARRSLNGHRRLVLPRSAVLTPLAAEELRQAGVEVVREGAPQTVAVGVGADRPYPLVRTAMQALGRDGIALVDLPSCEGGACDWARAVAACVGAGTCRGGVVFCGDPGLLCCVANKVPGLRAVAVTGVGQAARAAHGLGANLLAVEMPGRTFFEVRQLLRSLVAAPPCPDGVACVLRGLDGHAHR